MSSRLRPILLRQRDTVADILRSSREFMEYSEPIDIARLEDLMKQRTRQIQLLEQLEKERHQLLGEGDELDTTLQPLQAEILEALKILVALDDHLGELVFNTQLQLTNNLAFAPRFVNLGRNAVEEYHRANRVVDITR